MSESTIPKREPRPYEERPNETVVGRTEPSRLGYAVIVSRVYFDNAGTRVRFALVKDGNFLRHLDVTTELAEQLPALIGKALDT